MRVLVTGAGMVGCYAARELQQRGDEVTMLDVRPDTDFVARVAGPDVQTLQADVGALPELLEAARAVAPDAVFHTAGLIGATAQRNPWRAFTVNVVGALNSLQATAHCGARRMVYASTHGVLHKSAPVEAPITEDFPTGGSTRMYPSTKVATEAVLPAFAETLGVELAMLRFASIYGDGHFAGGSDFGLSVSELVEAALDGRPAAVPARIAHPGDVVYVKDAATAVGQALHASALGHHTYNVGGGRNATAEDLVEALRKVVPAFEATIPEPSGDTHAAKAHPMSLERSRDELGYEPAFDLEAGLRDYIDTRRAARRG